MLCDISGSMEPYARAYLQFLTCAAGSGPNAEAFVFATRLTRLTRALASRHPGAGDPAGCRDGAGLVERDPDRRRAEGVQRPSRASRNGARRRGRDPLGRLGAGRPEPGGTRDGAPRAPRPPHRLGQPSCRRREFSVRAGGMVAALEHCDALVSGHSFEALGEVVDAIGVSFGDGRGTPAEDFEPAPVRARRRRSRGPAPRRCPAARSRCRAATGRAGARRPPGGVAMTS